MSATLVRYASAPTMRWKNGLGVTTQLAIHPHDATADAFEWRVSIAQLEGSATFSVFEGVERCLAMLQGEMTLLRSGEPAVTLTPESPPIAFAGTVPAAGCVEVGSALDLNLMFRIARWDAAMSRFTAARGTTFEAKPTILLCALAPTRVAVGAEGYELERFDVLRVDADAQIAALSPIDAYRIALRGRSS